MSSEFLETLKAVLLNTFNPDRQVRQLAEDSLRSYLSQANAFSGFLQLAVQPDGNNDVKMAASLALKNHVRHFWSTGTGNANTLNPAPLFPMTLEEKEHVKVTIVEVALVETNNLIRAILAEIVKGIAEFEFPDNWKALLPTLVININGSDRLRVYNSLVILRKITKRLEYKADGKPREPLHLIMAGTFPAIQGLVENIKNMDLLEGAMCIHMVMKIFWSCIMYKLPKEESGLDYNYWFRLLAFLLERPIPPEGQPVHLEERTKWPWWKVKKWSSRIIMLFIQRYGNPKHVAKENVPFAKNFREFTSVDLLGPVMNTLAVPSKGGFLTPIVMTNCMAYLNTSIEMSPTYKMIKPHLDFVLFQVIYPNLFLSVEDADLLVDDPIEFIRKVHSPSMEFIDVRTSTVSLLETLVKLREKDCLAPLLSFVQSRLEEYQAASGEARAALHGHKDASLMTIGAVASRLIKSPQYKATIEPFFLHHVIPDLQSDSVMVRYRCLWVIEWFVQLEWGKLAPSTLQSLVDGILVNFRHASLAIQTGAACALRSIICTYLLCPFCAYF